MPLFRFELQRRKQRGELHAGRDRTHDGREQRIADNCRRVLDRRAGGGDGWTDRKQGRPHNRVDPRHSDSDVRQHGRVELNIVLLCQDFVENNRQIVAGGDSGSPVFGTNSSGGVTLLGNLWGGNSSGTMFVYSTIANIERELGQLTTN